MEYQEVKASFARCAALGDEFFDSFYASLVDRETAIGQMFAETDMQRQNQLIQDGIAQLIAYAEGNATAETHIRALGRSHSRHFINVPPDFYPLWVDSLLTALREHDPKFNSQLADEWKKVIAPGIALMISMY